MALTGPSASLVPPIAAGIAAVPKSCPLILFTFAATHFLNHALGLVSLEAMHAMQDWRKAVTRTWPGSIVLLGAFVTHIALALYKISLRLTWPAIVGNGEPEPSASLL